MEQVQVNGTPGPVSQQDWWWWWWRSTQELDLQVGSAGGPATGLGGGGAGTVVITLPRTYLQAGTALILVVEVAVLQQYHAGQL